MAIFPQEQWRNIPCSCWVCIFMWISTPVSSEWIAHFEPGWFCAGFNKWLVEKLGDHSSWQRSAVIFYPLELCSENLHVFWLEDINSGGYQIWSSNLQGENWKKKHYLWEALHYKLAFWILCVRGKWQYKSILVWISKFSIKIIGELICSQNCPVNQISSVSKTAALFLG